jgi:integrase/recombinase XerD
MKATYPNVLAQSVRSFFSEYLTEQRGVSRHTVLSQIPPAKPVA